jgi:hypothetical protein
LVANEVNPLPHLLLGFAGLIREGAMSEIRLTGGCQCGAVRYALHAIPAKPCICHCCMCQKAAGNLFGSFAGIACEDFELTRGELASFQSSDLAEHVFCAKCGTPLAYRYVDGSRISVTIGSLDEPKRMKPLAQYGVEGRLPWLDEALATPATITGAGDTQADMRAAERIHQRQHPDHDTEVWPPV